AAMNGKSLASMLPPQSPSLGASSRLPRLMPRLKCTAALGGLPNTKGSGPSPAPPAPAPPDEAPPLLPPPVPAPPAAAPPVAEPPVAAPPVAAPPVAAPPVAAPPVAVPPIPAPPEDAPPLVVPPPPPGAAPPEAVAPPVPGGTPPVVLSPPAPGAPPSAEPASSLWLPHPTATTRRSAARLAHCPSTSGRNTPGALAIALGAIFAFCAFFPGAQSA